MPWKLLFMGTVFESKWAQSTHLSLEPISGVCLILPIRNYACHLFLRRSHTSATCCQMLKFSGERSPQLNKLLFISSFCLGLLMFLLLLVPAAIFFCSLSKQWLNPRLQSEASPSSPRELQQRQTDPACAKGFSRHLAQGGVGRMRGMEIRSTSHPLGGLSYSSNKSTWGSHFSMDIEPATICTSASPLLHSSLWVPAWSRLQQRSPSHAQADLPAHPLQEGVWDVGWQQRQHPQGDEGRNTSAR